MRDTGDKGVFAEDNSEIMEINSAGVALSYYRNKYGLTLEQVCDGICSTSKLLRMEKGKRCVDSLTSSQLLERIGKTFDQFEQLLNEEDYALWCARESIRKHMQRNGKGYVPVGRVSLVGGCFGKAGLSCGRVLSGADQG